MKEINPLDAIKTKIHTIRGKQVILDRDLAELYEVETRVLKQAVKRNIKRFPDDFMFSLSDSEIDSMVSQSVIPSKKYFGGSQPYVFTEHGVANLSSILNSEKAIEVNLNIMRAFISMRKTIFQHSNILHKFQQIDQKFIEYDNNFEKVFKALETEKPKQGIFYNGQIFDAYVFFCDLIKTAKNRIILIDNYIDEKVLELFTKTEVEVTIYTKNMLKLDYTKYRQQYKNIEIKRFTLAHDRFLIIDAELYHIGASLKDLGKKWFGFSKMDEDSLKILDRLENPSKTVHKSL
jgi:hypothetical protein